MRDEARDIVERYLRRAGAHDVDGMLELLADDFTIRFPGGATLDRAAVPDALGWDIGTEGRLRWEVVDVGAEGVHGEGALRYTETDGRRWVALLRRWRAAS